MKVQKYKRGQVWWYKTTNYTFDGTTYNEGKTRPVIIMSNELANENSNCLLGIPCTTAEKKSLPTHTSLNLDGTDSTALAENLMSINKDRLTDYIGTVDNELLTQLEKSICIALGLSEIPKKSITNNIIVEPNIDTISDILPTIENKPVTKVKRKTINLEDKIIFIKDYENHDVDYMLKKYKIKDKRNLQQKVYIYRKSVKENS